MMQVLPWTVQQAKLDTLEQMDATESIYVVEKKKSSEGDTILKAIEGMRETLNAHIQSTGEQLKEQAVQINAISNQQYRNSNFFQNYDVPSNNSRGGYKGRGNNRDRRGGKRNNRNDYGGSSSEGGNVVCFKCNQPNPYARHCTASLN